MNSIQKPKSSSKVQLVSLQFKGESVRQDRDGRFSLNDLHRMSGTDKGKAPGEWAKLDGTKALVEVLQDQQDSNRVLTPIWKVMVSRRGNMGGTWAVMSLALAYASYLSPEFRAACLKVVDERIEEEQTPELYQNPLYFYMWQYLLIALLFEVLFPQNKILHFLNML